MNKRQHELALVASLAIFMVAGLVLAPMAIAGPLAHPLGVSPNTVCSITCSGGGDTFYGTNQSWMQTATAHWPQQASNWCGPANLQAIEYYDWLKYNGTTNVPYPNQQDIVNHLNSSAAISPWGIAVPLNTYPVAGFKADIANDIGTDPRATAWGAYEVTPPGYWFHNYIYGTDNNTALYLLGSDYGPSNGINDPVAAAIDLGEHWDVVDGVYATSDPSAGGETIDGIDTWDPSYGEPGSNGHQPSRQYTWSTYDWENYTSPNGHFQWKYPYSTWSQSNSTKELDPEPYSSGSSFGSTPNYYNVHIFDSSATLTAHWNQSFVTVEQDFVNSAAACNGSPNYALDRYGHLAPHNGSIACG